MKRMKGFTLIELLVVIAIIAILAAILFPVFAGARDKARQTTCYNNTKQISLAFMQYCDDWGNKFPTIIQTRGIADTFGYYYVLKPYIKSAGVLCCPNNPVRWGRVDYILNGARSYGLCGIIWWDKSFVKAAAQSELAYASSIVLISDNALDNYYGDINSGFWTQLLKPASHGAGMNFGFADGHAKWYDVSNVPNGVWTWDQYKISWWKGYRRAAG